ncbi:MAG: hypothetical protein WDN26_23870 [Chitinophagaceae bacterium]
MKSKLALSFLFLVVALTGCKSKSAMNFSNKIVGFEQDLGPAMIRTDEEVSKYYQEQNFDSAAAVSERMENLVGSKIEAIEKLETPAIDGAEDFKKSSLKYFSYIKSIYTTYRRYAEETDERAKEEARLKLLKTVGSKDEAIDDMQRAQQKFAKAAGFKIEDKK